MSTFEKPYFVAEDDTRPLPSLGVGDPERDRIAEYQALFEGEPRWASVLGTTIFTADANGVAEILVAVRDPEENTTHPNVVSTPTMRITPQSMVQSTAHKPLLVSQTPNKHVFKIDRRWRPGYLDAYNDAYGVQMDVDSLLETKLGIEPGPGWNTRLNYQATPHSLTLGDSRVGVDERGMDIIEKVAMLSVLVQTWPDQKDLFPSHTEHYRDIRWVSPDEYRSMQEEKNLLPVFDAMAAELCIHGVCIATSRVALDDMEDLLVIAKARAEQTAS
jgi:hypothetical protein